ncbi:MAG TPA: hypothetical protein VGM59_07920, partial [Dongiaceae bacterium]
MKLRAVQFGFAVALGGALSGLGGAAEPAAAQSYLNDGSDSGSVTVDYSVLGQGSAGTPYGRAGLPGGTVGTCSCAAAPLGVIANAPRPTFNSPYASAQVAQAPAVPPGFMPFSQAVASAGGGSSGGRVVLTPPSPQSSGAMSSSEPGASDMEPMPSATDNTPPQPAITGSTTTSVAPLPATTPTQSESQPVTSTANSAPNSTGEAGAPPAPETMPTEVPSPVPPAMANTTAPASAATENQAAAQPAPAPAPVPVAPATEAPATPAPENQAPASTENQAQPENPASTENQAAAAAPENQAAPATDNQTAATANNEQVAAVTPPAPAEGTNSGGALPAGAHRIAYSGDSDDVPAASTADLDAVAKAMLADENMRVQVLAYANGTPDEESKARRKSLARGLAVR